MSDYKLHELRLHRLIVREDFRRLVAPFETTVKLELEQTVRRFGCQNPILTWSWNNIVVDFEKYEICQKYRIPFRCKQISARNLNEVILWICRNQLERPDLPGAMRYYLIGKEYEMIRTLAATQPAVPRSQPSCELCNDIMTPKYEKLSTGLREMVGMRHHLSPGTIRKYFCTAQNIDIIYTISPALSDLLLSGKILLSHETIDRLARYPRHQLEQAAKTLIDASARKKPPCYLKVAQEQCIQAYVTQPVTVAGTIKEMPAFDPDAEIAGLALTIPSWISSIQRILQNRHYQNATPSGKRQLLEQLLSLQAVCSEMAEQIKGC